jgi:hypothetical protein
MRIALGLGAATTGCRITDRLQLNPSLKLSVLLTVHEGLTGVQLD